MQSTLSSHFLRQDIIDKLLAAGEGDSGEASRYANRLIEIAHVEDSEHAGLIDPFDRSVAIVFELFRDEDLDAWNVDLSQFIKLFSERIKKEGENINLPACGRLIRLAWEVLNGQAADLLDRAMQVEEEEFDDPNMHWGWEMEYDDDEFSFTTNVLTGDAQPQLPSLFNERIRRDEGRQVTLGELLSALKDACDDAEELKLREEYRIQHAEDVKEAIRNVGARMHDEDMDGDIKRCWQAMRTIATKDGRKAGDDIPVTAVISQLRADLLEEYGGEVEGLDGEAKVTAFISSLFLTHRGFAEVHQKVVPNGEVFLSDRWHGIEDFNEVVERINREKTALRKVNQAKAGGYEQHIKQIAIRAAEAERKAKKLAEAEKLEQQKPVIEITFTQQQEEIE
jgi:segregation and condensation protein A